MTPDQAADFAARITREIDDCLAKNNADGLHSTYAADRERVASDLRAIQRAEEGLREHQNRGVCGMCPNDNPCPDTRRYTEARDDAWSNLRRTGAPYGVTLERLGRG